MRRLVAIALVCLLALLPASAQVVLPGGGGSTYTLPAATSSTLGGVKPDGTTITNSAGAISVTYGTTANTAAQGGVITAGGPTGSATVAPIITYNAAGQLTTVSSATITPAVGSITGFGTGVATLLGGNATGTGGPVGSTSPTLITPVLGVATGTSLDGAAIGGVTPSSGAFTTLSASSTVSGSGFSTYLAAPPAIGGTTPAAGSFSVLSMTGNITRTDTTNFLISTSNQSGAVNATQVSLKAGNNTQASGTNNGGATAISAGNTSGASSSGNAGNASVIAGSATGAGSTGNGGSVVLTIGTSVGGSPGTLQFVNLAQTSAAQSGTVCFNTSGSAVTYDATLGCLTSLEELKKIHGPINGALAEVVAMKPFWFTPINRPPHSDVAEQPGFGAHQIEAVDKRLVGYDEKGNLRGVRYMEMTAVLAAAIKEQQAEIADLRNQLAEIRAAK